MCGCGGLGGLAGGVRGGMGEGMGRGVGGKRTLEPRLDHVEWVDSEGRGGAGAEAGDGLDQRGGHARMVVIHSKVSGGAWLMRGCWSSEGTRDK